MTSLDVAAVHTGIADAVNDAHLNLGTLEVIATDYMPLAPTVPHFYPFSWRAIYDRTFGGMVELTETWHLCISMSDDLSGYAEASRLASSGENTIRSALIAARGEPSPTPTALGGAADDVHLTTSSGPTSVELGEAHLLVVEFTILVIGG